MTGQTPYKLVHTYDGLGRPSSISSPDGKITTFTYDGFNETHVTTAPDPVNGGTKVIETLEIVRGGKGIIKSRTRNGVTINYNMGFDREGYPYNQVVSGGKEIS